ncbi:MAG: bifunctional (p)ppGpp synthetase/guanosine-3',5'-bis(diphosphate) 3'-pyrophosphohydrolase [Clostridiales bacterium]|nr:bifunctional (p)ppGpp synthetase/guanosine-3',5'-bis(diphosphate) 3'-pyrophosphohydrolase [Clostridiales bacterium]
MLYEKALQLATKAHEGQKDKGGHPYIGHPLAVAEKVLKPEEKVAALLHDVVEDTDITLEDLEKEFPPCIVTVVDLVTKKKGPDFSRKKYLEEIRKNEAARQVKLADLEHNMDLGRIPHPTEKDFRRMERYKKDREYLCKNPTEE